MINQRNNICKICNDAIVVEDLNRTIFFAADTLPFSRDVEFDNSLFARTFWVRLASLSFEINRLSLYWLKTSKNIVFFSFFLEFSSRRFWRQSNRKSITKNSKQKEFLFFSSSSSISIISTQDLFNDERFELFVSQRFETSLFMTNFSLKILFSSS